MRWQWVMVSCMVEVAATVPSGERRRHARTTCRIDVMLHCHAGQVAVPAHTIDVSDGGMRLRSYRRMPVGPCSVELMAVSGGSISVRAAVIDEAIDVEGGEVTARIQFDSAVRQLRQRLLVVGGPAPVIVDARPVVSPRRRARWLVVAAAGALVLPLAVVSTLDRSSTALEPQLVRSAAAPTRHLVEGVPVTRTSASVEPVLPADPAAPVASAEPARPARPARPATPARSTAPTPVAAVTAPAADPTPAPPVVEERVESADHPVDVRRAADGTVEVEANALASSGVDALRVQLTATPQPSGSEVPVSVSVENRSDAPVDLGATFSPEVVASIDGVTVASVTLQGPAVDELLRGEQVHAHGSIALGTGEYQLDVRVPVATVAASS